MSITYQSRIIVDFHSEGVTGKPALGFFRLIFSFRYEVIPHQEKQYSFYHVKAEVKAGVTTQKTQLLGIAEPESPLYIKTTHNPLSSTISFFLDLDKSRVNAIEKMRNGGDLYFKLRIYGQADGEQGPWPAQDELLISVNQKAWRVALKQMDFEDFLLFEIPLPIDEIQGELKESISLLEKAKEFFLSGFYDDTVATCRKVLESFSKARKEDKKKASAVSAFREKRQKGMTKEQRGLFLKEALRHYTHLAHHPMENGISICYTRDEAGMVLGCTAAIVSSDRIRMICRQNEQTP